MLFIHTLACMWIFLAFENETNYQSNWIEAFGYDKQSNTELYITACYFTVTTITTVGYGDISATESGERILGIVTMLFGVIAFSFATGTLSSIISNSDSKTAAYRERLETLKRIKYDYDIGDNLFEQLNAFISFQSMQRDDQRDNLIKELPERLRLELSHKLYKEYRKHIYFFKEVR